MKSRFDRAAKAAAAPSRWSRTRIRALYSRASSVSLLVLLTVSGLTGCRTDRSAQKQEEAAEKPAGEKPVASEEGSVSYVEQALIDVAPQCRLNQRGLSIDLGSPLVESRRLFRLRQDEPPSLGGRMGESFRKFDRMNTEFVFWLTEEKSEFEFQGHVHGLESERMAVYIDGKRLGAARLKNGETRVVRISAGKLKLEPGRHKLGISLSRPRSGNPSAEISWIRLGDPNTPSSDYPATTNQTFSEVTVDKERNRSVILSPGTNLRCPLWIAPNTTLRTKIGLWGEGAGEAELVIITEDGSRYVIAEDSREKSEPRSWKSVAIDLSRFGSQLVELELVNHSPHRGARIAFADPKLQSRVDGVSRSPKAARAIVLVMSGLGKHHFPPEAGKNGLPVFNQLAAEATTFKNYRASSSSATAFMASLLSGLPPWSHGLHGTEEKLNTGTPTLAGLVESQGGRSSAFTGVPTSFGEFGFDRGFELFKSVAPQEDEAATAPLTLARDWLESALKHEGPVLSIVNLRGGHPPFDVSRDVARKLEPEEYGGDLSPRRAAIQLGNIRARARRHQRMPEEDWQRLRALQKSALLRQNKALGEFIGWLRSENAYDDTLLIIVGDLSAGERPDIPFSDDAPLTENYLSNPLLIKFPGGHAAKKHIPGWFAPRDLTETIAASLGLELPDKSDRIDLGTGGATDSSRMRPHIAFRNDAYSMRYAGALLRGENGSAPHLCRPELDPSCSEDRSHAHITESRALWFTLWSSLAPAMNDQEQPKRLESPERLTNALTVWGIPQ